MSISKTTTFSEMLAAVKSPMTIAKAEPGAPETRTAGPVAAKLASLKVASLSKTGPVPNWVLMLVSLAAVSAAAWYYLIKKKTRRRRRR